MSFAPVLGIDVTSVSDTAEFKLGQHGAVIDSPTKLYKYIQYDTGSVGTAAVAGEASYYYTLDGYKNNVVTSDLSDSIEIGAGILQAVMTDLQFGWIQIKGAATMTIALTAGADGDILCPTGAADGTLDVIADDVSHGCAIAGDISDKEIICDFPF
jgi:NAD(P)H-nitrite reductase large subunit